MHGLQFLDSGSKMIFIVDLRKGEPMTRDEFMDLVGADYVDEYEKAQLSQEDATIVAKSKRTFVELLVHYPHPDVCTYPEYKGKPYYSIKYIEDGECFVGFGTYKPEVLSQYLRDYFMSSAQPEEAIPVSWIEARIKRFMTMDNAFGGLTANIMLVMLNEWKRKQEGETT